MGATITAAELRELAVATDTKLAKLDEAFGALEQRIAYSLIIAHRLAGDERRYQRVGRRQVQSWGMGDEEAVAKVRAGQVQSYDQRTAKDNVAELDKLTAAAAENRKEAARLEAVHDEHGWSRFFLVKASNGHIHYDMSNYRCSRTPTTVHGWSPELSGATEAEAVAELGPRMCTVCFPTAPVEWTVGEQPKDRCKGSGAYVRYDGPRYRTVYVECPECGAAVVRTPNGYARAHKPKS